jgi:hypothetical protein
MKKRRKRKKREVMGEEEVDNKNYFVMASSIF